MAVNGNTETVQTVLQIDTSKSASSMKELRTQIKELKNELVGLDRGSQEYADTLVVLGEKMHQLKEINQEVARTNTDFGDTLGNITNVMSGGVAAVQGLTAGLSLLGVEMGDDNKLTQKLIQSMALLQSLSTMDKAIKSFKALATVIKSNIAAAGGLGKALKALATNNPFGVMLVAATALVAVITSIIKKNKEIEEQEIEIQNKAKAAAQEILYMHKALEAGTTESKLQFNADKIEEAADVVRRGILDVVGSMNKAGQSAEEQAKHWGQAVTQEWEAAVKSGDKYKQMLIQVTQIKWEIQGINAKLLRGEIEQSEAASQIEEKWNQIYSVYGNYLKDQNKAANNSKKEVDYEKEKYDLALKRLNLQKTLDDTELQARYEEEKRAAQGNAEALLAIEEKYQNDRKILNERYYQSAIELAENFKQTRKTESEIVDVDQTIANLNKSLQEGADAWQEYKTENASANIELQRTKLEAQSNIDSLDRQTAAMEREIEITREHNERYLELVQQKWTLQADLDAEAIRYQQEQLQNANVGIEDDLTALRTRHETEMELLQEQYDQKLIAEEEFQQRKAELEAQYNNESMALLQQHFENEAQLDELAVEAKRNEVERKKELQETYMSAISSITNSITAVLNEAANAEDVSFEDQKKLKIASTIITTLTTAMESFQAMASIPYVGPALGAAAAASTIAVGMMQVNKIRQTKKNSTTASASTGAVTTVQSPAQIVNLNAVNDEIELPDSRVYVVESDITEAQNRVQVVESNSEI